MTPYDWSYLKAALVILSIMGGFTWLGFFVQEHTCESRAELMGLPYTWNVVTGCMVKTPAGWAPLESVRVTP